MQVLNATKTRGLARRATMLLRDRGFDVVEIGHDERESRQHARAAICPATRTGRAAWRGRLGSARVETRPDSSRYLDITVVLGATWRPPAQPFYP